jgi:glycosyltransferase involved in cell wall biosynthesis
VLTVLSVGFPLAPVGPDAAGGAEQVLSMLDEALLEAGHRSLVVAPEGSTTRGTLYATPPARPPYHDDVCKRVRRDHAQNIVRVLSENDVDIVHLHGVDFFEYLPPAGVRALVTLHLPPSFYPRRALPPDRAETFVHCVSESQMRRFPAAVRGSHRVLPPLANGIRTERFRPAAHKNHRLAVALGRICPEKGFHLALDAAREAGVDLELAGAVFGYPAHEDYFTRQIAPRLDERRRFVGTLGLREKVEWLARARCLLVPSLVEETSSLVAMEALASGTPVVAFRAGALTEIVENGRTGFLVDDASSMAAAIDACGDIDPRVCRETAERRFSASVMSARYLDRYLRLRKGAPGV